MNEDQKRDPEARRLKEDARRDKNWKRWGPYLSERQWATVREDYSPDGNCCYFPHVGGQVQVRFARNGRLQ